MLHLTNLTFLNYLGEIRMRPLQKISAQWGPSFFSKGSGAYESSHNSDIV